MEFDFGIIWRSLPELLQGLKITVVAFFMALGLGLPVAVLICAGRLRETSLLARLAGGYVSVFRTIPEMILIFWMFYCLPTISGLSISGLASGTIALGLAAGAYLSEIFRAGVQSVPPGQWEAAKALALPRRTLWASIVIPQAARLSIPPFINYLTELLKGTTLLASIGVAELALKSYVLGAQTFRYLEFLTAIAMLYFVIIFPIARLAERVEHRLAAAMK